MAAPAGVYSWLNGALVPENQAFLQVSDLSIQRGYGVFDYFKVRQNQPLFLDDYLIRFYCSADLMGLPLNYGPDELKNIIRMLLDKNNIPEAGIKMILTGGYSPDGYTPGTPNLIITQNALAAPANTQIQNGIKIITHQFTRELPEAKTINYTMGIRLLGKIKEMGADEVLYHENGEVSEFPRCNFFIVTPDNEVLTPDKNVLRGITRQNVLTLARQKYPTREQIISLTDIYQAKEAFLTSTTKRILPIVQIDETIIGTGKPGIITQELLQNLMDWENKNLKV